jgi:hypothetical protein
MYQWLLVGGLAVLMSTAICKLALAYGSLGKGE